MKRLRIFVASPGDVHEERQIVVLVVDELRRILGSIRDVELEAVKWETHAWPGVGDDAQDVINHEIGEFDIFVGIMWRRFGTPTKRASSGTGEEFDRAYNSFQEHGRPNIMFYFRTTPFYTTNSTELAQFGKVVRFRKKLTRGGVLFWEYETPLEFERFVREHLIRQVLSLSELSPPPVKGRARKASKLLVAPARPAAEASYVFLSAERHDAPRVLPVYRALSDAGLRPWLDTQNLVPGVRWEAAISDAISASDIFIPFISQHSVSARGFFRKELDLALARAIKPSQRMTIIPVRLDHVPPPESLATLHWLDLTSSRDIQTLITTIEVIRETKRSLSERRKRRAGSGAA